jgi:hypothetical protein
MWVDSPCTSKANTLLDVGIQVPLGAARGVVREPHSNAEIDICGHVPRTFTPIGSLKILAPHLPSTFHHATKVFTA